MGQPFVGEVRMFCTDYAPRSWMSCDGAEISMNQYQTLYSVIHVAYGGDDITVFAVPNLMGRAVMHWGNGPGLLNHSYGEAWGEPFISLTESQIPSHTHTLAGDSQVPETGTPDRNHMIGSLIEAGVSQAAYSDTLVPILEPMASEALSVTGAGSDHENRQPYLVIPFFIALEGVYPARS